MSIRDATGRDLRINQWSVCRIDERSTVADPKLDTRKAVVELLEKRDVGRLEATGVDERLLRFSLPAAVPAFDDGDQNLLAEASTAAEEFGTAVGVRSLIADRTILIPVRDAEAQ